MKMKNARFYIFIGCSFLQFYGILSFEEFGDQTRPERAAKEFSSFGFSVEPTSLVAVRNESARLDCATHGSATVKIEWRIESTTIRPDSRRQILANGSLLITKVTGTSPLLLDQTDEGDYQCVAVVDDVGTFVSRKAKLKVASLSRFEAQPSDRSVTLGATVALPCVVEGTPQPVFTWYKDGNVVDLSIAGRLTLIPKIGSLEIQNVSGADEGAYQCRAANSDKWRNSEAGKLTVVGSSAPNVARQPVFESKPQSVVVVEGMTTTLECSANGHPHPKIQWLKNQKFLDLAANPRFKVVGQGSLVISNVQAGDEGQFTCRAMNSEDSSDSSASVVVHTPPSFVSVPRSIVAKETEDVHFECEAEGKPGPSVLWMKNGEILTPSDYFQIEGVRLKINGLVMSDWGVFQCLAENTAGTAQASSQLIVERAGKNRSESGGASSADLFGRDKPADSHSLLPTVETPETSDRGGTEGNNRGPSEPIQIRSIFVSSRYVTIRWDPPTNPGGEIIAYSIYYKQDGSARERVVNSSAPNLEEVTVNLLVPSTAYYFRVVAYNKYGPGRSGGPLKVTTTSAKAVPGKVRNLKAEAVSPVSIVVSWDPPQEEGAAVAMYKLFYRRVEDGDDQTKADITDDNEQDDFGNLDETEVQLTTTSYDFHDLDKFATYSFRVECLSRNGPGPSSDPVRVRTLSDVPSGAPLNVTAEPATSKSVVINWNPPAKDEQNGIITGYKVRYKKKYTNDSSSQITFTTDGSSRSHILADLVPASVYALRVAAVTANGTGPWSVWLHVSTYAKDLDESQVPGAPAQLQLLAKGKSILIEWVPPADNSIMIRGYKIGWGLGGVPDGEMVKLLGSKHKSHRLDNLKTGRPYLVSVRAFNNVGEGYPSYETATTTDTETIVTVGLLLPPVGLRAETLSSTAISLKWSDQDVSSGVIGETDGAKISDNRRYVVQYTAKYLNGKALNQTVKDLTATIEKLRPFTTYEFSVKVVKGKGESPWSMNAYNTTLEAAPGSPPQEITVMQIENTDSVVVNWRVPRMANGNIIGYSLFWTDDVSKPDQEWTITTVKDGRTSATLENLRNGAVYHFKLQAMTEKGWGPMSNATRYKTQKSLFPADSASAGTRSVPGNRYSPDDPKAGGGLTNTIIIATVVGVCLVTVITAVSLGICFCRRQNARKRDGYQAGVKKPGAHKEVQNPPDLWIHHHENIDRRYSTKNGDSQMGSVQDLRIRDPSPPLPTMGMELAEREVLLNNSRPLSCVRSVDESVSSSGTIGRRVGWARPMVQSSPVSQTDFSDPLPPNGTLGRNRMKTGSNSDLQPSAPRSVAHPMLPQYGSVVYTGQKHHQHDHGKSPYGSGFVGPPPVAQHVPLPQVPSGTPALVHMGTNSSDVSSLSTGSNPSRLSNPLSSFVSAPPPPSSISPNPQRVVANGSRSINNNGDLAAYPYVSVTSSTPGQSNQRKPAGIVIGTKSPAGINPITSAPRFTNDPYVSRRELEIESLPHSHSTEELNAQMKSLDSLMKDLNDISQNEFDVL